MRPETGHGMSRWGDVAEEASRSDQGVDSSSALFFISLVVVRRALVVAEWWPKPAVVGRG